MTRWIDRTVRGALAAVALSGLGACAYPPALDGESTQGAGQQTARSAYGVVSAVEPLARDTSSAARSALSSAATSPMATRAPRPPWWGPLPAP